MLRLLVVGFMINHLVFSQPSMLVEDLILENRFEDVISQTLKFFINRQKRDGSLVYDHLPFKGRTVYKGNWVRLAGAFLSMAWAYNGQDEDLKSSLKRLMGFFKQHSQAFEREGIRLRVISENHEGFTGTICLFLSGAFVLHHRYPDQFPLGEALYQELMDTVEYYHHKDEGLTDYINIKETYLEKQVRPSEIYATAQHFYLQALYHVGFNKYFLHPSLRKYLSFYDRKWTYGELGPSYHWVMQALYLVDLLKNPDLKVQTARVVETLQSSYEKEFPLEFSSNNYCSQLEGYGSYLLYKQGRRELNRFQLYKLSEHLRHTRNFQFLETTRRQNKSASSSKNPPATLAQKSPKYSVGGFWNKEDKVYHTRIDYSQHCLSAFLHHRTLLENIGLGRAQDPRDRVEIPRLNEPPPPPDKKMHPVVLKTILR
jgi:hypothetical protein